MHGETFSQDDEVVVPISSKFFGAAISWMLFYHVVLRPLNMFPIETQLHDINKELNPRFPLNLYFKSWRDYEHVCDLPLSSLICI